MDIEATNDPSVQAMTHRYLIGTPPKVREVTNRFFGTWTTPRELTLLLEQAGLRVEGFHSDYTLPSGTTPDWSNARRIIATARRATKRA